MTDNGYLHRKSETWGKLPEALMHDPAVTDGAKVMYAHMHWRYGSNGSNFEGRKSMSELLGVTEATISSRITELVRKNWIVRVDRRKENQTNFYHVFEQQAECIAWKTEHTTSNKFDQGTSNQLDQGTTPIPPVVETVNPVKKSSYPDSDHPDSVTSDSSLRSESSVSQPQNSTNAEAQSKQSEGSTEGQPSPVASSDKVIAQVYDAIPLRHYVDISLETLRVKTNLAIGDLAASVEVLLQRGVIRKTSDVPTYARMPNDDRIAYCNHCKADRSWTESMLKGVYGCDVCKSLVTEAILWPEPSAIVNTEPVEPPAGFELLSGTASDAPIHLRKAGQSLRAKPLCKDELSYRLKPTPDMTRSRKKCEKCWKIATEPKQPKAKREKKPQPWDALGEAIARELFGAKDKAGVSAVFGRIAPVLHGDKRSGRCIGLIAYECEKQGKDKAELDYQALADMVPVFYKDVLKINSIPPKDCAKVLDAWQAWRSRQKSSGPKKLGVDFQIVEPDDYIAPGPAR